MRFTLSSSALSGKLTALSRVINSKNALPILGDFVFEIKDNILYLTASDSENMMKTQLELTESDGYCRFAIGNHDLLEAVKGFSEQPITFDVDQEKNIVKISYQNGLFSLPIENADEFPMAQPVSDFATIITLPNLILAENINRSVFATAQDELRPVMNGIYFDLTAEGLAVVASDGHKLVRNKVFTITSEQPAAFILPKKPANLLRNLLGKDGGDVIIRFDERNAEVNYGDGILQCRLIEGRYPNYNSVIPQNTCAAFRQRLEQPDPLPCGGLYPAVGCRGLRLLEDGYGADDLRIQRPADEHWFQGLVVHRGAEQLRLPGGDHPVGRPQPCRSGTALRAA